MGRRRSFEEKFKPQPRHVAQARSMKCEGMSVNEIMRVLGAPCDWVAEQVRDVEPYHVNEGNKPRI